MKKGGVIARKRPPGRGFAGRVFPAGRRRADPQEGVELDEEARAAARHLIGQCLEVRSCSAQVLREALLVEERACSALGEELAGLGAAGWEGLSENVRKFRSDLLRRDLREGRTLFPVSVYRMDPVQISGE